MLFHPREKVKILFMELQGIFPKRQNKLEAILYSIMSKVFRFIEVLGGILGFLIGLIQIALLQFQ